MSGETEREPSGWTVDTLRAYFQRQIDALSTRLDERWSTDRRAIDKAEQGAVRALEAARVEARERLQSHNGLIEKLEAATQRHELARTADSATFATKESLTAVEKLLLQRIEKMEAFQSKIVGGLVLAAAIGVANFVRVWFR